MGAPLGNPEEKIHADFSVLYSGGLDSTAVPLLMSKKFTGKIHLLTLDHNFGHFFVNWSEKHVRDLQRVLGQDRVFHSILNISEIFRKIALNNFWKDFGKYGHFIWCLGCILSLMTRIIIYNLTHKSPYAFICSTIGGEHAVMSLPISIETIRQICARYGIDYRAPLLELNIMKPEERELLHAHDIWPGYRIITKGVHGVQPICIPGLQHIMDNLFGIHTTYNNEKVRAFILDRAKMMQGFIETHFAEQGVNLQACIEALNKHHGEGNLQAIKENGPPRGR